MQSLSNDEISSLAHSLESYENSRLQKIESGETWISFLFYGHGQEKPLYLSLHPKNPLLLPVETPRSLKKKTIPALLFLRAHFDNHILRKVSHDPNEGRVLHLYFSNGGELEIRLFPHGQNLIATVEEKKLSTHKVSELQEQTPVKPKTESSRSVDEMIEEFLTEFESQKPAVNEENKKELIQKALQKKKRALELVEKDMAEKKLAPFRELGEWMKAHQSLRVQKEWVDHIEPQKSFAENLNAIFAKAKQVDEKLKSADLRRAELQTEISKLEKGEWQAPQASQSPMKKGGAKGRTKELEGGQLLYLGRNAKENIKILRAAQPWDYWLHVKDFPGSHGIIRRNKQETITDRTFIEALQQLIAKQFGSKGKIHEGEKFACLIAECRYVKPIKGDRIGRVTYQNERVLTVQFKS